jgi:dTDP-4-amino-4,6-dideoxygalactose transaminase
MSLRKAVSRKLKEENGVDFAPEQIVVSNGAKQALCNVILASINPGDEVLIPTPAWVSYVEMVKLARGTNVLVPTTLEDDFKMRMFSLMEEMKNILEGGASTMDNAEIIEETTVEEVAIEEPVVEEPAAEETPVVEETPAVEEDPAQETEVPAVEEPVAATYDLNNIVEYQELQTKYSELAENYNTLEATNASLVAELERLRIFKATIDKREKQNMINSFYMLSDEDKKDVIENIDTYSVDDIEAKLSIICVRNKVNFNLEEDNTNNNEEEPITYSLQDCQDDMIPAWVKSLQSVAESMK